MNKFILSFALIAAAIFYPGWAKEVDPLAPDGVRAGPDGNIGLLVEWIQLDHEAANALLHQFGDQPTATALREALEQRLDKEEAKLVESSYVVTTPGQRARTESHLEYIFPTEVDLEGLPQEFGKKAFKNLSKSVGIPSFYLVPLVSS